MAKGPAVLVQGLPITAEALRSYAQLLLVAADQMAEGELTVSETSSIIDGIEPCGARTVYMQLTLHEPRTLN